MAQSFGYLNFWNRVFLMNWNKITTFSMQCSMRYQNDGSGSIKIRKSLRSSALFLHNIKKTKFPFVNARVYFISRAWRFTCKLKTIFWPLKNKYNLRKMIEQEQGFPINYRDNEAPPRKTSRLRLVDGGDRQMMRPNQMK
jgi:hypothetical protein